MKSKTQQEHQCHIGVGPQCHELLTNESQNKVQDAHSAESGDIPPPFIFHPPYLVPPPPSMETCIPPFGHSRDMRQTVLKREKGFLAISTQNKTLIIKNDIILSI